MFDPLSQLLKHRFCSKKLASSFSFAREKKRSQRNGQSVTAEISDLVIFAVPLWVDKFRYLYDCISIIYCSCRYDIMF